LTPSVALLFSAAGQQGFDVDQDCALVGVSKTQSGTCVVSTDPVLLTTDVTAPSVTKISTDIYYMAATVTMTFAGRVPVSAGSRLFVAVSAAGSVVLLFDIPEKVQ